MNSSGIKRGLATAAVTALAITGAATYAGPALADPGSAQTGGSTVVLAIPSGTTLSTKNDGTDSSIRLEALGDSTVSTIHFEYSISGAGYQDIATVSRNDDGYFGYDWTAPGLNGATVTIRATGLDGNGATVGSAVSGNELISNAADSISLNPGSAKGVFQQPYASSAPTGTANDVIVRGTTSAAPGSTVSTRWYEEGTGFTGTQPATVSAAGTYSNVLDISGYTYTNTNNLLVGATATQDSDGEGYTLYTQDITTVTAAAAMSTVPNGDTTTVTVTVTDQSGAPIAGARVAPTGSPGSAAFTDRFGQATFTQGAGSQTYYADVSDVAGDQQQLGDVQSNTVTVNQYTPVQTSLVGMSHDGPAFDFDENSLSDITVQVEDQNGNDIATNSQTLSYYWTVTPFDGSPAVRVPATGQRTGVPQGNGLYDVAFPTPADFTGGNQPAGTYVLTASLGVDNQGNHSLPATDVLSVKAGNATITTDSTSPQQAALGTSAVVSGTLAIEDGTPLPGRNVQGTISAVNTDGSAGQGGIVQSNGSNGNSRTIPTGTNGTFAFTVKDPNNDTTPERDAVTLDTVSSATYGADPNAGFSSNSQNPQVVKFVSTPTAPVLDVETSLGYGTPGAPEPFAVYATDSDGEALANQSVTLTVDHGFFTNGVPTPAPVAGAEAGYYDNRGTSITVVTDSSGEADGYLDIQRDAGFDDDGLVDATLTAAAGGSSNSNVQYWSSSNPLNGASVQITRAPASQQTNNGDDKLTVLPKAPTRTGFDDTVVYYDVYARDQFGNLTDGDVDVTDNLGSAYVNGVDGGDTVVAQYLDDTHAVELSSDVAGNDTPTANWDAPSTTYTNSSGATTSTNKPVTPSIGETTAWYLIDFTASHYLLSHDTTGTVPVGGTVVETYTVTDQNGQVMPGVEVQFFRSGPDVLQDGSPATNTFNDTTDSNGQAVYVFSGAAAGTATLQALIFDSNGVDEQPARVVNQSRANDSVVFGSATPTAPAAINADLSGKSKGSKDVIKVDAPSSAAGATVTVYKKVTNSNGKTVLRKVKVKKGHLNSAGNKTFKVKDTNGNAKTKYIVVVSPTAATQGDTSKINIR